MIVEDFLYRWVNNSFLFMFRKSEKRSQKQLYSAVNENRYWYTVENGVYRERQPGDLF